MGGGVGQLIFIILTWAGSIRINKSLIWWRKVLPKNIRVVIGKLWLASLIVFFLMSLSALEMAIFGFVLNVNNPEQVLHICLAILGFALVILLLIFVSEFAHDIERLDNRHAV